MAKNELLPFANGEDANVLPTQQWEALTDILENGFQSGVARSEQVNRVLAQGAVASYVLGQLIVDQLNKDATLDKDTLYQNIVKALQENAKDACLPLSGGTLNGELWCNGALRATGAIRTFFDIGIKSSVANGGQVTLYSEDDDTYPNSVTLISNDGTNYHRLRLLNNGRLELDGKSIVTSNTPFAPDYSAGVHIDTTNTFTAPSAGIVFLICTSNPKGPSTILVNGIQVSVFNNGAEYVDRTNYAFVAKGDVITFVPVGGSHTRRFYPLKVSV